MAAPSGTELNVNVGILGHVDSGKTSLAKVLSTTTSTACFDKNPQSKERGITLDLGFSSFTVDIPPHLQDGHHDRLQFTLVDCPGHASLIRTIIGGSQIIDMMMLVIDITKGMQTQTAECLVIGEITCNKMIVVLNKSDMIPENKRQQTIEKMMKRMRKTLENTKFKDAAIVTIAAKPGGPDAEGVQPIGVADLIEKMKESSYKPERENSGPLLFSVDHCFGIRGQGTVMTGTLLHGGVKVNDVIEIPGLKITRKVKSIQKFRQPVTTATQGDRVGICVTQFDPDQLERGLVCTPGSLQTLYAGVVSVNRIPYYKENVRAKAKFHVTMGHDTVMAKAIFFTSTSSDFSLQNEFIYQDELPRVDQSQDAMSQQSDSQSEDTCNTQSNRFWALLEFEKPVVCPESCLVIASKLDTDIHSNVCRLAFYGQLELPVIDRNYKETVLPRLKIFKEKYRQGVVDRMADNYTVIGRSLFKKESNIDNFLNLRVTLSTGEVGVIEGGFGQSGKFKVRVPEGLAPSTITALSSAGKKKSRPNSQGQPVSSTESTVKSLIEIHLKFKKYVYDTTHKMIQS